MTGHIFLDSVTLAVSLANTILLTWLGLTVWLNAQKRTRGVWIISSGALIGAAFFISHNAILGAGLGSPLISINYWWRAGWFPLILAPLAWYGVILWFAGLWSGDPNPIYRRHRFGLAITLLTGLILTITLLIFNPIPSFLHLADFGPPQNTAVNTLTIFLFAFAAFITLCIGLSLEMIWSSQSLEFVREDLARRRARPWLLGTSGILFFICFLVGWAMIWYFLNASDRIFNLEIYRIFASFDLAISALLYAAIILMGQAFVLYEISTEKTLPRRRLQDQWKRTIILATGLGGVIGVSIVSNLSAVYSLMLTILILTTFYALLTWRLLAERERFMRYLRPFVSSQHLYENLLETSSPIQSDLDSPFRALCNEVLRARSAHLVPIGPLAPLIGSGLDFPKEIGLDNAPLTEVPRSHDSSEKIYIPLDPGDNHGISWAIPLWSERGPIGFLYLGQKVNGDLYTQEEFEIARAVGERLIDTWASAELARRLMSLQRNHLVESQVADQRIRRILHDEILPKLHTGILELEPHNSGVDITPFTEVHSQIANFLREIPPATTRDVIHKGLIFGLRQVLEGELAGAFESVDWDIDPQVDIQLNNLHPLISEVVFYAAREVIRNAAHHGSKGKLPNPLNLTIKAVWNHGLSLLIKDNGCGLELTKTKGGTLGQGLALHSTMLAVIGGSLTVNSVKNQFTKVEIDIPEHQALTSYI